MQVTIINPNSTQAMTQSMVEAARQAMPGITFDGWTSQLGPPSIQGPEDGEAATGPFLELATRAHREGTDGIIIGCFDDTALREAAARVDCPVIGIGQAAYHYCALRQKRFSVVTTLPVSVPVLEANIAAMGLAHLLGKVRASDVPVLALESNPDAACARIVSEAEQAVAEDEIDALVLGCAGMVHVTRAVRRAVLVEVVDPVEAAARCAGWLCAGQPVLHDA